MRAEQAIEKRKMNREIHIGRFLLDTVMQGDRGIRDRLKISKNSRN